MIRYGPHVFLAAVSLAALQCNEREHGKKTGEKFPVPVEASPIAQGPMTLRRTFSGSLEAPSGFVVAPKISGQIERLPLNIGDAVKRGQLVVKLYDDEYRQAVAQAHAELVVANARITEASAALEAVTRQVTRGKALHEQQIISDDRFDEIHAEFLAKQAQHEVARAQRVRAQAALHSAQVRLSYARIVGDWHEGDDERVIAERYFNEGDTVPANTPVLSIVELSPLRAAIFVAEKDYSYLNVDLRAVITTDAFPTQTFDGTVARVAPVFKEDSRQARVEIAVPNTDKILKPGMFVRVTLSLAHEERAIQVPASALTTRDGKQGVFLIDERHKRAVWKPVDVGIRDGDRVQIIGDGLSGKVVTLGQQLIEDNASITLANESSTP